MPTKLYIAYGSNLNTIQMQCRCPGATIAGKSELEGFRLVFRGRPGSACATVEPDESSSVPVLLWNITEADERLLDRYEAYPVHYRKEHLHVKLNGENVLGMIYIMTEGRPLNRPSDGYYQIIRKGYEESNLDFSILEAATKQSSQESPLTPTIREQIFAIRDSGETNMFDVNTVQYLADKFGYYELVCFLEDHRKEYVNFIIFGEGED